MKKRLLSIIVLLNFAISSIAFPTMTASAAVKPSVSVSNINSGQRVVWNNSGSSKYYLYFGVYDYKTKKYQWRVYKEVYGTSYDITYNTLHSSGWKKYVNYQSTSNLSSGQCYCYQIHAGMINASGRPIDSNYSCVKSMTYLSVPYLNWTIEDNQVELGAYTRGANAYQYRYRYNSESYYYYITPLTNSYATIDYDIGCRYEARALYRTASNGTAYSAWAHVNL